MGKGGGSAPAQPTSQTVQQSNIPEYARPYFEDIMTRGTTASNVAYQPYTGERVAPFSSLQEQAFQGIQGLGPSPLVGAGAGLTGLAAGQAAQAGQYNPMQAQQTYQGPQFQGIGIEYLGAQAPQLQQFQMGPAERARTGSFAMPGTAEAYMSPYMQNVVDIQQREAQRQADIARTQRGAQAVGAGAFGGSRQAIQEAEAARNLALQKGDIQAAGLQSAYQQAQQAYQTDAQRQLQAQLANQQAGLTVGGQNLQALLQTQGLGAQTGMQAQQLNQAAQLQAQQQALGQSQAQNAFNQQNAQLAAQYGLAGLQAGEQSRQFGANLGLQGAGMLGQLGGQFGQLGQTAYGQNLASLQAQQQAGAIQQAQGQQQRDLAYEEFMRQQLYPQSQLQFLSSLLRGSVVAPQQTMYTYQQQPSMVSQLGGLGLGALGLSNAFAKKDGGEIKGYADGGTTGEGEGGVASNVAKLTKFLMASQNPEQDAKRMSGTPIEKYLALQKVQQLRGAMQNQQALNRGVPQGTVMDEMGLAGMDVGALDDGYASGGIVAFEDGGMPRGQARFDITDPFGIYSGLKALYNRPREYATPEEEARARRLEALAAERAPAVPAGLPAALPAAVTPEVAQLAGRPATRPEDFAKPGIASALPQPRPEAPPARAAVTPAPAVKSAEDDIAAMRKTLEGLGKDLPSREEAEESRRTALRKAIPDDLQERLDSYKAEATQALKERDQDRWLAVAMGGFAAAAGSSPYALKNFGEGLGLTTKELMSVNKDFRKMESERQKLMREEQRLARAEKLGVEKEALAAGDARDKRLDAYNKVKADAQSKLAELANRKYGYELEHKGRMAQVAATKEGTSAYREAALHSKNITAFNTAVQKEKDALIKANPTGGLTDPGFEAKMEQQALRNVVTRNPQFAELAGVTMSATTAQPTATSRYNPKTGKLEPVQ